MDAELSQMPAFQTSQSQMKDLLRELREESATKEKMTALDEEGDNEEDGEEFEDMEDDELQFVMNMLQAQIEGLGTNSGPYQQIMQQLGLSLGHSINH